MKILQLDLLLLTGLCLFFNLFAFILINKERINGWINQYKSKKNINRMLTEVLEKGRKY